MALPAAAQRTYVATEAGAGRFPLAVNGHPAPLFVSAGDLPGVVRAARDLQHDLSRVSGDSARLYLEALPGSRHVVLIGTIGQSPVLDRLVQMGKLDVSDVAGRWEAFLIQVVEEPLPGVAQALVIAGSDRRGTVFGIYDVAEKIGVSPWTWWADVPVRHQPDLYVLPGRHVEAPAVEYRGIFLNDENPALLGWANEAFGGFNHRFYTRVFELLLRLKGNYLWPAMWGKAFADDDPLNASLAHEYGVVVGTSHHEPMMRAHVEWSRYGTGPWHYEHNADTLRDFWRRGIERMGDYESLVTIGMRGDGDEPMTDGTAIALLERIVAGQRQILEAVTGRDPATVPQVWALYKEVQDYYDRGMRVPDDVTLLFADDNWGNLRRLPAPGETRPGGYGIYYHFDYVGGPRNYKWLNTNQIERVWEQMHLAYHHGATRLWIVNVGDLKPMEFPTEFFLDYAWNPEAIAADSLPAYTQAWAAAQFGRAQAAEIASLLAMYTRFNSRRKPELLAPSTYSLVHFREAERVAAQWEALVEQARRIREELAPAYHDAYFQLVQFPIEASANLNKLYVAAGLNRLYAQQGRAATNRMADSVRAYFAHDAELTRQYHEDVAGGKWNHMMSQTHIGYTSWQEPPENVMPEVVEIDVPATAAMGIAAEGTEAAWPQDSTLVLPELSPFGPPSRYIEIFRRGSHLFGLAIEIGAPWLRVSAPQDSRATDGQRVEVSVDWAQAPAGRHKVPITITGTHGEQAVVEAVVFNPTESEAVEGFVEAGGYVSMHAGHFTEAVDDDTVFWQRIPNLGREGSAMTALPATASPSEPGGSSPHLAYRMHLFTGGEVEVHTYLSPTLDFHATGGRRFAVSIGDEPPQTVAFQPEETLQTWEQAVADNVVIVKTRHRVKGPGPHTLRFWRVDSGVVVQKLVVVTGALPPSYLGPPESLFRSSNQ